MSWQSKTSPSSLIGQAGTRVWHVESREGKPQGKGKILALNSFANESTSKGLRDDDQGEALKFESLDPSYKAYK
ncbi:hypothetical protein Tco_0651944 [Tanacetum coccineum]|uniref:Uncharacterized protein n=1 Tax=Tanacetum coccineum TaxID=301880 RepID=A0ABQ4WWT7_9ASTR